MDLKFLNNAVTGTALQPDPDRAPHGRRRLRGNTITTPCRPIFFMSHSGDAITAAAGGRRQHDSTSAPPVSFNGAFTARDDRHVHRRDDRGQRHQRGHEQRDLGDQLARPSRAAPTASSPTRSCAATRSGRASRQPRRVVHRRRHRRAREANEIGGFATRHPHRHASARTHPDRRGRQRNRIVGNGVRLRQHRRYALDAQRQLVGLQRRPGRVRLRHGDRHEVDSDPWLVARPDRVADLDRDRRQHLDAQRVGEHRTATAPRRAGRSSRRAA